MEKPRDDHTIGGASCIIIFSFRFFALIQINILKRGLIRLKSILLLDYFIKQGILLISKFAEIWLQMLNAGSLMLRSGVRPLLVGECGVNVELSLVKLILQVSQLRLAQGVDSGRFTLEAIDRLLQLPDLNLLHSNFLARSLGAWAIRLGHWGS